MSLLSNALVAVLSSLVAFSAHAASTGPFSPVLLTNMAAPISVNTNGAQNFDELKKIYDQGILPDEKELTGNWRFVSFAATLECISQLWGDTYSPNGIRNQDGTYFTLTFARTTTTGGGFGDATPQSVFSVKISNYGSKVRTQGPYQVSLTEPQFSRKQYKWDDSIIDDDYIEQSCRLVSNNHDKIICAAKEIQSEALLEKYPSTRLCMMQPQTSFWGFVRVPDAPAPQPTKPPPKPVPKHH